MKQVCQGIFTAPFGIRWYEAAPSMEASQTQGAVLARRRFLCRTGVFAVTMGSVAYGAALIACGGTTGREGLSTPDSATDATLEDGGFDVGIQYIDRVLPDLYVAPMDAGGGEASDWPNCAPDLPIIVPYDAGVPDWDAAMINAEAAVPSNGIAYEVPAVWGDDGGESLAADGSTCAVHSWLGSAACDECVKIASGGQVGNPWYGEYGNLAVLPPCSDLAEAGVAIAGPGANTSRFELCKAAFKCMLDSYCFAQNPVHCYCATGNCITTGPNGPCAKQFQAALEIPDNTSNPGAVTALMAMYWGDTSLTVSQPGHGGAALGVIAGVLQANCVPPMSQACAPDAGSD